MSTLLEPTGPLPRRVYWFRRLLVLGLVVLVAVAGWWVFLRSDSSASDPAASTPTTVSSSSGSATPTPTGSSSPDSRATSSPTPSTSTTPAQPECRSKDIQVTVTTDRQSYPPDVLPTFTLAVENVGTQTCRRDVGQRALELTVSSGGVQVWSSDDCNPGGPAAERVFGPGDRFVQPVSWSRQRSEPGCPSGEPLADPGQYQVVGRNLDVRSEPASFTLT